MEGPQQSSHIAILPTPGMGHLIPLTEFAKQLVLKHNFSVTFIIPTHSSHMQPQKTILESLPKGINTIFLPPVSYEDLPKDSKIEVRITLSVTRSIPAIGDVLNSLRKSNTGLGALVVDMFGTDAIDVAIEFGISPYVFYTSSAMALSCTYYLPRLEESCTCEYRDLLEPVKIPGCIPIHGTDLPDPAQDRNSEPYKLSLHRSKKFNLSDGILVNSLLDLEPVAFKALEMKEERWCKVLVYPVGPLVKNGSDSGDGVAKCFNWLDEQPSGSVLYVSFGSGGTLSSEQLVELALGLEMSEQRFLWVVKIPNDKVSNATYFNVESIENPLHFLPNGFVERTKQRGLLIPSWAPQIEILSHGSTGGFMSHCGWNSTLESIIRGVPMIAWPPFAEQRMNAVLLTNELNVALRVKKNENGLVEKQEIARCARGLIGDEGEHLRSKMRKLKDAAAMAVSPSGSSTISISEVAQILKHPKTM